MVLFNRYDKSSFNNIDVIKVCMAAFVIATHTSLFSFINNKEIENIITVALSVKVPFFFAASGFLVWNKIHNASKEDKLIRIKKWISKTFRLYWVWTLIYLPFTIYGFYLDGIGIVKSIIFFFRNFLLVGQNFWSWPLWYLLGMLVAGLILYIIVKYEIRDYVMYSIAFVLAITGALLNYFHEYGIMSIIVEPYFKLFNTTRNGFFEGFPYIVIGIAIASYGVLRYKVILYGILLVSFVIHLMEIKLATFFMTYALFSIVMLFDFKDRRDHFYRNCRLTSTILYFVHMIWVGCLTLIYPQLNPFAMFVLTLLLSFVTAKGVLFYKETKIVKYCFR